MENSYVQRVRKLVEHFESFETKEKEGNDSEQQDFKYKNRSEST